MLNTMKKFFDFCNEENRRKFKVSIVLSVAAIFLLALKIPAIAVMIQGILDGEMTNSIIWTAFGLMLVSVIGSSAIKYKATMLQTEAGYRTAANKRMEIAEHMRYLPMGYFNENSLGQIMSVTTNTMENLADVGTRVVMLICEGVLSTLIITLMVFTFDVRIGLIIVLELCLYLFANMLLQRSAKKISEEKIKSDTDVVEKVLEYIKGISEVKAYHMTGKYNKNLDKAIDENSNINTKLEFSLIPYMTLQNYIAKFVGISICTASLYFYTSGTMTLLNCIMMIICSFMILEGLELAGNYSALVRIVDLSVDKANDILNIKEMDIEGENISPETHNINTKNIDFAYEKKKIIDNVTLKIPSNTTTAIVGPSGSGKTTLCHLISRFWDVDSGTVTLDNKDIRNYSMDSLMENYSFVFQNVYLFKDTIANNIRFGSPKASMEEVVAAAKAAKCHEFIMNLKNGYDTVIGESGGSLSGGERQRLSIARAIMKDSPIIILDEATANVDPENEKDLMEAIEALTKEKTIIMIAHRIKTVENADNIIVLDEGRIVQQGTHNELIKEEGIYKRFVGERNKINSWKL